MLARSCKISQAGTGVAFVVLGLWGKAWRAACYLSVSWWRLPAFQSCTCAFLSGTKQTQAKENNKYKEERKKHINAYSRHRHCNLWERRLSPASWPIRCRNSHRFHLTLVLCSVWSNRANTGKKWGNTAHSAISSLSEQTRRQT